MAAPRCSSSSSSATDMKPVVDLCVAGEAVGTEEQTAVTITGVPQAAFAADHNVQYQFRTENSGGQVRTRRTSPLHDNRFLHAG